MTAVVQQALAAPQTGFVPAVGRVLFATSLAPTISGLEGIRQGNVGLYGMPKSTLVANVWLPFRQTSPVFFRPNWSQRMQAQPSAQVEWAMMTGGAIRALVESDRLYAARQLVAVSGSELVRDLAPLHSWRRLLQPARVTRSASRDRDRRSEFMWLKANSSQYRGKWVAVSGGELLAAADTYEEVSSRLKQLTRTDALVFRFGK